MHIDARPCGECGEPVEGRKSYCSPRCKGRAKHARQIASGTVAAKYARQQERMGYTPRAVLPAECVEPDCAEAPIARGKCPRHYRAERRAEGHPSYQGGGRGRRRAERWGAEYERLVPVEVFERDGWICGFCDEPVDRSAKWPAPESPSLDHVVPLSLGGGHVSDNVRCSHLRCNIAAGNRSRATIEQGVGYASAAYG